MLLSSAAAFAAETITYTSDARGRLVQVQHAGTVNNGLQTSYTLDEADNRTTARADHRCRSPANPLRLHQPASLLQKCSGLGRRVGRAYLAADFHLRMPDLGKLLGRRG
jgi:hypothetical protein